MIYLPQVHEKGASETRLVAIDFDDVLEAGESFAGTPTLTEVGTSALSLSSPAVSDAAREILGRSVPAGRALLFACAGGTAGVTYRIGVTCGTDATPAQVIERGVRIEVI